MVVTPKKLSHSSSKSKKLVLILHHSIFGKQSFVFKENNNLKYIVQGHTINRRKNWYTFYLLKIVTSKFQVKNTSSKSKTLV
jgi:hypothetical protein